MSPDLEAARAELDEYVGHVATTDALPSVAWGVVHDGELVLDGGAGQVASGRVPTTDTVYRIASMTKSFSAAAVLALRDDGVVSLDQPIGEIAPELAAIRLPTSDSPPITLRLLLSMGSGLASDDPWADRHLDIDEASLTALVDGGLRFAVAPGTPVMEYSNLGFGLIGRVIQRATGETLQTHISRRLIAPLGLGRTTWTQPPHDDWARPFRLDVEPDGNRVVRADGDPLGDGGIAPMGGLWTTVADLARWVAWLDDAFPARDGADPGPLRRASRREMQQVQRGRPTSVTAASGEGLGAVPERIDAGGYGFGLSVFHDSRLGHHVMHSGGLPGYGSNMRWLPGRRIGVVAVANLTYAAMARMTRRMLELLDDHGLVPPVTVPLTNDLDDAARRLVGLLDDWNDEIATELFADNVALDTDLDRRAAEARRLVGPGRLSVTKVVAESAAAATVHATSDDGREVRIELDLAPTQPARIQYYGIDVIGDPERTG